MAGILLKRGQLDNAALCEFAVDSVDDIQYLPTMTTKATGKFADNPDFARRPPMGSTCIVGNEGGDLLVYQLFSFGWKSLS